MFIDKMKRKEWVFYDPLWQCEGLVGSGNACLLTSKQVKKKLIQMNINKMMINRICTMIDVR